jgi:XTP/dITP diphosphohydrolase
MKKLEKLVIATRNPAKVDYYRNVLGYVAEEIMGLEDLGIEGTPRETGSTAEDNAKIKARFYAKQCDLPVFSVDEALYTDFQPESKQPGTHVRRIDGKNEADDDRLLAYWEEIIAKVPADKRTGRWHTAYCLIMPEGDIRITARDHPIIFFSPSSKKRIKGWPMSSLEGPKRFGKPHSEVSVEEDAEIQKETAEKLKAVMSELLD